MIAVDPTGKRKKRPGRPAVDAGPRRPQLPVVPQRQFTGTTSRSPRPRRSPTARSTPAPTAKRKISVPVDWGRYRLEVETADPTARRPAIEFDAGWYVAATSTETPDGLEIALDKDRLCCRRSRQAENIAALCRRVAGDGRRRDAAHDHDRHGAGRRRDVDIPVGDDWGAGAYVTATLFRPGDAQEIAHADARHRHQMAEGRSGRAASSRSRSAPSTRPSRARRSSIPVSVTGAGAGDRRLCHGRRGRCRHPQPHQLQGARPGSLVLRPAPARPRNARPLRPPDRRLARRDRQAPHRRRRRAACRAAAARRPRSWSPSSPDR